MTILLLETIDDSALACLDPFGPVVLSPTPHAHDHALPFSEVRAIITRGRGTLDKALMDKCPGLEVIARCGAGLNNLDLRAAAERNLPVVHAPGFNAGAVAEQTLMLMLMTVRQGFASALSVKQNNWSSRDHFSGDDLAGKTVCIVGGGNVGSRVASLCDAFSMETIICGREGGTVEDLRARLVKALPCSDIVSLHVPLTADTNALFDKALIAHMQPHTVLINTARGELIDTDALLGALNNNTLAGYGSDVASGETPLLDDPLVGHPKTVVTPHVAALTKRTYRDMCMFTAQNVAHVLTGKLPAPSSVYQA